MKLFVVAIFLLLLTYALLILLPHKVSAIYDPLARANNYHGIHILFPSELEQAAPLVNSKDGEWGYVTIPIQAGDKDLKKWQDFMDKAKKLKLIPIVRLSTEGDYLNTNVWRIPTDADVLDFANFLDSLDWPLQNRYVIIFNEMNRFDEWGGEKPNPEAYADILDYAIDVFKSKSTDFYIIMGGLDNASPNDGIKYLDNLVYLRRILKYNPALFNKLDGFASHSYPNPDFSRAPSSTAIEGVATYKYEYEIVNSVTSHKVPVFITETGWNSKKLGEATVAKYYKEAYELIWGKDTDKIVAITPFLLNSQGGSFDTFSFIKDGKETQYFTIAKEEKKVKGEPLLRAVKGIQSVSMGELIKKKFIKKESTFEIPAELLVTEYIKLFF